jgi:hypothetical protein
MLGRDDFTPKVKRTLEARAGHRCSFPGCTTVTVGPSDESNTSVSKTGMACHIAAAAGGPGARRYVASMTATERSSIENGVWMCYTHGKLIDTDEKRFTRPMLKKWREFAEFRARCAVEFGADAPLPQHELPKIGFAARDITLNSLGVENETIGYALEDCCVPVVWGEELAHAVRDVMIEFVRNAFIHGRAKQCTIRIEHRAVRIVDDGGDFNCLDLKHHEDKTGGATALQYLISEFGDKLILAVHREEDTNETLFALANTVKDVLLARPCVLSISKGDFELIKKGQLPAELLEIDVEPCRVVYILLAPYLAPSDSIRLRETIGQDGFGNRQIVFVAPQISSLVRRQLLEFFPGCRVVSIPESHE